MEFTMLEEYMTIWHLKMLVLWILINCSIPWYVIWSNTHLKPDPKRDIAKFTPWVRTDTHEWSYVMCIFTHFFFIPRYFTLLLCLVFAFIGTTILSIGSKIDNLGSTRVWLILQYIKICMRVFGYCFGVPYFTFKRPKVDYSEWLGPDWKPSYEGATMIISNHQSWYEVFMTFFFVRPMPGFIAKSSVKNVPSVGMVATAIGSVYLDRRDKARRNQVFEIIKKRQEEVEEGKAAPLLVFPEGGTTNGKVMTAFKKGAFASLKPVKPHIVRAWTLVGSGTRGDMMGLWHWSFLIPFMNIITLPELLEMPVFAPNDYFWNKYWDGKNEEEKWEVFAKAVRQVMAKTGGFALSDSV